MSEAPKFEDSLAALEKLVAELEAGDLGLDEALKRFEKGVKLAGQMQKSLEDTHRRIEQLGAPQAAKGSDADGDGGAEPDDPEPPARGRASKGPKSGPAPTLF